MENKQAGRFHLKPNLAGSNVTFGPLFSFEARKPLKIAL